MTRAHASRFTSSMQGFSLFPTANAASRGSMTSTQALRIGAQLSGQSGPTKTAAAILGGRDFLKGLSTFSVLGTVTKKGTAIGGALFGSRYRVADANFFNRGKSTSTRAGILDINSPTAKPRANGRIPPQPAIRFDTPHTGHPGAKNPHVNVGRSYRSTAQVGKLTDHMSVPKSVVSGAGRTAALARGAKVLGPVALVADAVAIGGAVKADGGTWGRNTTVEVAKSAGGWAGAWAGMKAGAAIGGAGGAVVGGVGAIPGAVVGGLVGAVGGAFAGSWLAGKAANAATKPAPTITTPQNMVVKTNSIAPVSSALPASSTSSKSIWGKTKSLFGFGG